MSYALPSGPGDPVDTGNAGLGDFDAQAFAPSDAAQWIRENLDRYLDLWPSILDLMHRAAVAAADARERGDLETYRLGRRVIESLQDLAQLHQGTTEKLEAYREFFGLGAVQVPITLLTVMSTLAALIVWQFRRFDVQQNLVAAMERGAITADDVRVLNEGPPGPVAQLGQLGKLLLWGGALLVLVLVLRERGYLSNPQLLLLENPPAGGEEIGERVFQVRYRHAQDGSPYYHDFGPGVRMEGQEDGSVVLYHPRKRLWRDFGD